MRTYQKTVYEGELLGDIDWSYNFAPHFDCMCTSEQQKAEAMFTQVNNLWQVERLHKKGILLRIREGDYWHDLIAMGMYDGWPYWKPVPAILVAGPIGSEWKHFPWCIDEWKERGGRT